MDPVTKTGIPFLLFGSTGVGIKVYMRDGGKLDGDLLVFLPDTGKESNSTSGTSASDSQTKVTSSQPTTAKKQTYADTLSKTDKLTLVGANTKDDVLDNILIQRLYPHYYETYKFGINQIFQGSKAFNLTGKNYTTKDNKTLFILEKHDSTDKDNLKNTCAKELQEEHITDTKNNGHENSKRQYYKLKEWCTEPTVKAVLGRHKLIPLNTNEKNNKDENDWKEIIGGGWFASSYKNKQNIIPKNELDSFLGGSDKEIKNKSDVTSEQIKTLKGKCKTILDKPLVKNSFPASRDFLDQLKDNDDKSKFTRVDDVYEAGIFCTKPMSVDDYVQKGMHGKSVTEIETHFANDYCKVEGKSLNDYKNLKTYEPMNGKSFWCAVRLMYGPKNGKPKPKGS